MRHSRSVRHWKRWKAVTWPIQWVGVPGPEQVQLKVRGPGVE